MIVMVGKDGRKLIPDQTCSGFIHHQSEEKSCDGMWSSVHVD